MATNQMTPNQMYAGLNTRFEKRAQILRNFGFKYTVVEIAPKCTVAVFTRTRFGKTLAVQSATVMHANKAAWIETLKTIYNRG